MLHDQRFLLRLRALVFHRLLEPAFARRAFFFVIVVVRVLFHAHRATRSSCRENGEVGARGRAPKRVREGGLPCVIGVKP